MNKIPNRTKITRKSNAKATAAPSQLSERNINRKVSRNK